MYGFDIIIKNNLLKEKYGRQYEKWVNLSSDYVYQLERTGQVLKNNHQIIINDNTIRISVICPEKKSLSSKYNSVYNVENIRQLEQTIGGKIQHLPTGRDADNISYKVPESASFYILRYGWESPLMCGDTNKSIPLYKIPCTDHGGVDYDNIYFWNKNYERLNGLWLSSGAYEDFAQEQLQNVNSPINKTGRDLCSIIEKKTNIPTYYFLFNYRGWTEKEDFARKCPLTGNNWSIKDKTTTDFIAFKCDKSRLVSELSTNSCEDEKP